MRQNDQWPLEPHGAWLPGLAVTFHGTLRTRPQPCFLICAVGLRSHSRAQPGPAAVLRLAGRWQCWASKGPCPGQDFPPLRAQAPPHLESRVGQVVLATLHTRDWPRMLVPPRNPGSHGTSLSCGQRVIRVGGGNKSWPAWSSSPAASPPPPPSISMSVVLGEGWAERKEPVWTKPER